ncbi:hypothetical protein FRB94_007363 [Tulasnella sp. JGI-2019a]|nr:hypothetical protein FRB94_007363 [Tulasnella sp. JGI-2019a]KAG9014479.1 hypothetical protein FRB93_013604 [Tulasnella sp. JGI-2019a]
MIRGDYKQLIWTFKGVGKSCLLARWYCDGWPWYINPTDGVTYETRTVNYDNDNVEKHTWDISGRTHPQSLAPNYTSTIAIAWIVYDVTDQRSFDNVRAWHGSVCQDSLIVIALVGNKIDLIGRVITTQQGERLAAELGVKLFETSAKTNQGKLFHFIPLYQIRNE